MRKFTATLLFLFLHITADANRIDQRQHFNWSEPRFQPIVRIDFPSRCTGQFVAPNIILTNRHCLAGGRTHDTLITNPNYPPRINIMLHNNQRAHAYLISYGRRVNHEDWAFLHVRNPAHHSNRYFSISPQRRNPNNIISAGFGGLRIMTDEEIRRARGVIDSYFADLFHGRRFVTEVLQSYGFANINNDALIGMQCATQDAGRMGRNLLGRNDLTVNERDMITTGCIAVGGNSGGPYFVGNELIGVHVHSPNFVGRGYRQESTGVRASTLVNQLNSARAHVAQFEQSQSFEQQRFEREQAEAERRAQELAAQAERDEAYRAAAEQAAADAAAKQAQADRYAAQLAEMMAPHAGAISAAFAALPGTLSERARAEAEQAEIAEQEIEIRISELETTIDEIIADISTVDDVGIFVLLAKVAELSEIEQARENLRAARAREQSRANRMLGGLTIAATGLGGWMWAEGRAQQRVDDRWNDEITAIYASMFCNVGGPGNRVDVGAGAHTSMTNLALVELRYEYMDLMMETRELKYVLGLPPGIEAVDIIDTSRLYAGEGATHVGTMDLSTVAERIEAGDAARRGDIGRNVAIGGAAAGVAGDAIINRTVMGFGTPTGRIGAGRTPTAGDAN